MHAISIKNLHKSYDNGVHALRGINLDIKEGNFFGLLGSNGAGKTTLISVLTTLAMKTEGTVSIFGYDLDSQPKQAKQLMGIVPQHINLHANDAVLLAASMQAGYYGIPKNIARERAEHLLNVL
ncbi:unnamed protein product, partial [marine sediment metagenome]